jgi:hypothetical protein
MATTQTKNGAPSFDAAFEQVKVTATRRVGTLYVESYEKAADRAIELELKVAGLTQQEWLKNLIEAQADLQREFVESYTTAARELIK